MDGQTDKQLDGWMDGLMAGLMDGWAKLCAQYNMQSLWHEYGEVSTSSSM